MRLGIILLVVAMTNIAVIGKTGKRVRGEIKGGVGFFPYQSFRPGLIHTPGAFSVAAAAAAAAAPKPPPSTIIPRVGDGDVSAMDAGIIMKTSSTHRSCPKGYNLNGINAWCAGRRDLNQYVEFNSLIPVKWVAVATQPRVSHNQYVKSYKIQYTKNGKDWKYYNNGHIFTANVKGSAIVYNKLINLLATAIRIRPQTWNGYLSMRFNAYYNPA